MPAAIEWTPELYTEIENAILDGDPIETILKRIGISKASFYRQRLHDPAFDTSIARAQEISQEQEVENMLAFADSAENKEQAEVMKLRIWTRMWIAGKRKPKKYGEKLEHSGPDGGPIQIVSTIPRPPKE